MLGREGEAQITVAVEIGEVVAELGARHVDHARAGQEITEARVLAVEHRQQDKRQRPEEGEPAERVVHGQAGDHEDDRNIGLYLAQRVARKHRRRRQPAAVMRDDAQLHQPLAGRRRPRAHLEGHEVAGAQEEGVEEIGDLEQAGRDDVLLVEIVVIGQGQPDEERHQRQQEDEDDVDDQRAQAFAEGGVDERQDDAFRRQDLRRRAAVFAIGRVGHEIAFNGRHGSCPPFVRRTGNRRPTERT